MTAALVDAVTVDDSDIESQLDTFWDAYWTLDDEWQPLADGPVRHIHEPVTRHGEPLILF